ncbi:MAG: hypothetical protein J6J24_02050 [Clostridia bacterium]|nr:hypothetical protein [Clostridia bacterium]
MGNKKSIFKSIFLYICAICFLSGSLLFLQEPTKSKQVFAENTISEEIENKNLPQYFSAEEWQVDTKNTADPSDDIYKNQESSLTESNTFLHYLEGSTSNYFKLSLLQNGASVNTESVNDIYTRVYYPNPTDLSTFYFYSINSINLYVNGTKQTINMGDFVIKSGLSFANKSEVQLDGFEMYFTNGQPLNNVDQARQISILDNNGEVVEGVYTLSLTYGLFLCTDGGISATEEKFSDESITLNYNFYVLDRDNFLANNNPNIKRVNFDKEVPITELTNRNYAYYLYSNFSSQGTSADDSYKMPYIEYDYTRFETTISKELSEITTTQKFTLDKDAYSDNITNAESELSPVVCDGTNIVKTKLDKDKKTIKVFFHDVGNYNITFNAIKLVDFETGKDEFELKKYNLSGLSGITKKVNVYMYGYQANYTNIDLPANEHNVRPVSELKTPNVETEKFEYSADITSGFLNSDPAYSQQTGSTSFLITNVLNYINTNNLTPVKTDQTPIKFTSNATLSQGISSYIYSTVKANNSYTSYSVEADPAAKKLNGSPLYRTKFTGLTDNAAGKYIYIIAYTFNNFYSAETTLAASTSFYQVFYFEIEKELPAIEIKTKDIDGNDIDVLNGNFINKDATITDITDTHLENSYKKDVTIQIYAKDFSGGYLSGFGEENGISFKDLETDSKLVLTSNAHYTVRLYYTSEITSQNILLSSKNGYFREQTFTIDKVQVQNITARNFVEITNSTNYRYYSTLTAEQFSTNQSIAISWDEKASTAKTYAYYRYFPLVSTKYYSKSESKASSTIERMLNYSSDKHYLPINYVLDMSTTNNQWLEYKGNTKGSEEIASDFIFSDEGLYLIDVYDEAGNHSVEVFIIDKTTPVFSINDGSGYSLVSSSVFITKPCSLYWGNYKSIYIANFSTLSYNSRYTAENIDEYFSELDKATYNFYKTHQGRTSTDIFKKVYNKLYKKDYLEHITNTTQINCEADGLSDKYFSSGGYSSYYLTIPINNRTYYIDQNHPSYTSKEGADNWKQSLTTDEEMTYRVLLRDLSNTRFDQTIQDPNNLLHYTGYYSAYQTIIVSFDDSEFFVEYQNAGQPTPLSSNTVVEDEVTVNVEGTDTTHRTKTTFLSPTKMAKAFSLSFIPTSTDGEKQIQVDKVTIKYYPYVESFVTITDPADPTKQIKYSYYELSDEATEMTVYDFSENGAMTDKKTDEIRLDAKNMTTAGKYIITRTYKLDSGYSYNDNDYYQRTYIFTVDRNDVITSAELTKENPHLESLVGGDIFISMYDTREDASLVVTFPNSEDGNTDGSSLYNNGSINPPRAVLTTNKMPLRLYIPQFKYTTYVSPINGSGNYNFDVNYNFNQIEDGNLLAAATEGVNLDDMNYFNETLLIPEYILSANIYKGSIDPRNLVATANPMTERVDAGGNNYLAFDSRKTSRGFLQFYKTDGTLLDYLSDEGTYYVELMQGRFGIEVAENQYLQTINFAFEIKDVSPDFTAQAITGASLTSEINRSGFDEIYYTNQPNLNLIWNTGSKYMAEIDIPEITFKMSNKVTPIHAATVDPTTGEYIYENIFVDTPKISGKQYVAQISLEKLGVYAHDAYVDITMQYKNHNTEFYKVVKKRIVIDLSAPSNNINILVNNSIKDSKISPLTANSLRSYYTAKMEQTKNPTTTSYNVSNGTGTFAYYSYTVSQNYLATLQEATNGADDTFHIYARKFADPLGNVTKYSSNEEQETSPANFLPTNNFTAIAENGSFTTSSFTFDTNSYYEIIEIDKAGNMSIYTIYIVNYNETVDDINGYNKLISYTSVNPVTGAIEESNYTIADYKLTKDHPGAIHNIYSKTGFQLKKLNYFGDAWAQIDLDAIDAAGFKTTYHLMLTPWDKNYAYAFSGQSYTKILISDLVDGTVSSRFKNCLSFYNRQNSIYENFYINIRNTTLSSSLTNKQEEEYIRFAQPNDTAIQNTIYGSTYLTGLKITTNKDILPIYNESNKLGYANGWVSNEKIIVLYDSNAGTLTFKLNPSYNFDTDTKIIYEYKDNFGNVDRQIHIYRETIITKVVDAEKDLYAYYDNNTGNLRYITEDGLKYSYNPAKYDIKVFEVSSGMVSELEVIQSDTYLAGGFDPAKTSTLATWTESSQSGYLTKTIHHAEAGVDPGTLTDDYNNTFAICVFNKDDGSPIQTVFFTLYKELPKANLEDRINKRGEFRIDDANNNNITANIINQTPGASKGYFSEIRLSYILKEDPFIPVQYSISTDKVNWRTLANGEILRCTTDSIEKYYLKVWYDEQYLKNEIGASNYVFGLVAEEQIYEFNLSALTQTYWVEQTRNGHTYIVQKSNKIYRTNSGTQYSNHYIMNVNYSDKSDKPIKTNEELKISTLFIESYEDGAGVTSDLWLVSNEGAALGNIPKFSTYVVLSYIPTTSNFVEEFFVSNADGLINDSENLINLTSEKGAVSKSIVINENSTVDQLELRWTKYYGIPQNEINISVIKDGIELFPNVYSKTIGSKQYNYIRLNHSGKYQIKLYDSSTPSNIQKFNRGKAGQSETFNIIFLKDVPFTVTYTNPITNKEETSLPINEAVYNGTVTIKIDKSTRPEFYTSSGYPVISVKRNGVDYTETFKDDATYIFDKTGYYEISFSAVSNLPEIGNIRKQTYRFTILNANEYRYSYIYNRFSNYYIEKVEKNGIDVTDTLTKILDVSTMTINNKVYLTELPLSYLDEKTGKGSYMITVNSNDKLLKSSTAITKYTFKVVIEVGTAPIKVSLGEGQTTTSTINVSYNLSNIYREMGECNFRIIKYVEDRISTVYSKDIVGTSSGEELQAIEEAGTYYIQILSPSGNLLYSYKVIKQNPLNAAAIIAIAISALVLVAAIILVVKLRKKISVK